MKGGQCVCSSWGKWERELEDEAEVQAGQCQAQAIGCVRHLNVYLM